GWRNAGNKPIKNCDLWQKLDALNEEYQVTWHWIRGHQGHPDNERADQLANRGIEELTLKSL
ncbi:MAG TPA: ribonuclease HI, partial [Alphaproteobacteria bacterium]|nr:ribonuclease HI [Alphaproteobacteria bacterium]